MIRSPPPSRILPSEITPPEVFFDRRAVLAAGLSLGMSSLLPAAETQPPEAKLKYTRNAKLSVSEEPNSFEDITGYNNFYEFGTDKSDPAANSGTLKPRPWSVTVDGECEVKGKFTLEDILKPHPLEERVYRFRCVEAWSMVVPWLGFPLADLVTRFKPTSKARYVEFTTLLDPKQMPYQRSGILDWPYVEGLRMDEAMHPLTLMVVGVYGKTLPNQNGAPLRLIVPWKWLLRQRESKGGSSALEPGHGAASGQVAVQVAPGNADVQRLREGSRGSLSRHGSAEVLLNVGQRYERIYKPLIFAASLVPFLLLVLGAFGLAGQDLGADPVKEILHTCGKTALNLLMLTLLVTPVKDLLHQPNLLRIRRMLGLFVFFYVVVHFIVYVVLDLELNFGTLAEDIAKRPYITIGFAALLMLIPLAVTSTNKMMRRLGRRWTKLHRLVYVIAILGVWHYYWQVKKDVREPLIYAAILALLLGYRLYKRWRVTSKSAPATVPERT
jgi:sulfoxide reductase catalytic subunit YedY